MAKPSVAINSHVLRSAYLARGFTQKRLADEIEVDISTIRNWLSNISSPTTENFVKLCDTLQVDPALLEMDSNTLITESKHFRVVDFHVRQMMGLNDPADYKEIRLLMQDIDMEGAIEQSAAKVKRGEFAIFDNNDEVNQYDDEKEIAEEANYG